MCVCVKKDLTLNNLQGLICHKIHPTSQLGDSVCIYVYNLHVCIFIY